MFLKGNLSIMMGRVFKQNNSNQFFFIIQLQYLLAFIVIQKNIIKPVKTGLKYKTSSVFYNVITRCATHADTIANFFFIAHW